MRISDWSSDVCSSDLHGRVEHGVEGDADELRSREVAMQAADLQEPVDLDPAIGAAHLEPVLHRPGVPGQQQPALRIARPHRGPPFIERSEEHTSELQSLMRISYAVFCLKKKQNYNTDTIHKQITAQNKNKNRHIIHQY